MFNYTVKSFPVVLVNEQSLYVVQILYYHFLLSEHSETQSLKFPNLIVIN